MNSISPNFFVQSIPDSIKYYEPLGFKLVAKVPEDGEMVWAMMTCGNVTIMFQTFESLGTELSAIKRENGGSLLFYIQIKGIRRFYEEVKDKVTVIKTIEKTFYGATEFAIQDINGYILTFAEDE